MRAARGERFQNVPVDWVTPAGRRSIAVSANTVPLAGVGDVALVTFEDVTELEAARRRASLLAEASAHLGRSLDPHEVAVSVAELMVPGFADWGFVELLQPDGSIVREGMAMADPSKRAIAEAYDRAVPARPGLPGRLAARDPHGRAAARSPRSRRSSSRSPRPSRRQREVLRGLGFALDHDRAAARPRRA